MIYPQGDQYMLTRRQTLLAATATAVIGIAGVDPAHAADKVVKIGVDLSLTGADSQGAVSVKNALVMAFDAANEGHAVPAGTTLTSAGIQPDANRRAASPPPRAVGPAGPART